MAVVIGAVLAFAFVLGPEGVLQYENWETVVFVFGMMAVIETLNLSGFFRWLGLHSARWVRLDPLKLFVLFPFVTAFLSAFLSSLTVMLFMTALTIEVAAHIKVNPLPLILSEIAASNIGGAATTVGAPPNLILSTHFHLSFIDFVKNMGAFAGIGFLLTTALFIWFFRSEILSARDRLRRRPDLLEKQLSSIEPALAIQDRRLFVVGLVGLVVVVAGLVTSQVTHLSIATVAVAGAALVFLLAGRKSGEVIQQLDYSTILFFAGLFIIVGALDSVGLLTAVAAGVRNISGGRFFPALTLILWVSAVGSSIVDNVPFAAAMAPIIGHLGGQPGFGVPPLVWSASLGTNIGGNGTPIGASANVVAVSTYERLTGKRVGWGFYCRVSYPAMMIVVLACNLLLYLFYAA